MRVDSTCGDISSVTDKESQDVLMTRDASRGKQWITGLRQCLMTQTSDEIHV